MFPEILQQVLVKFLYTWFQCKNLRVWEYIYSIRFIHYSKINSQLKIKFWVIAMDKVETFEMQPTKPWIKANLSCKAWIIFHNVLAILENVGSQEHCFEKYFKDYFLKKWLYTQMNHGHLDAVQNSNNQIIKEFSSPCSFGCFLEFGRSKASTFIRYLLELLKYSISKRWKHSNRLKERPDQWIVR